MNFSEEDNGRIADVVYDIFNNVKNGIKNYIGFTSLVYPIASNFLKGFKLKSVLYYNSLLREKLIELKRIEKEQSQQSKYQCSEPQNLKEEINELSIRIRFIKQEISLIVEHIKEIN